VSDYDRNEDGIFSCALAVFIVVALIGAVVLGSGHGIYMPPAAPPTTAGATTAP
jgi:hypothetical protein